MNEPRLKPIIAVAILFAAPWIYYFPAWLGPMAKSDNLVEMWHTARFAFDSIKHGIDPLWNPYINSGFPAIAYTNTGLYSLFNLPHLILPEVFALAAEMALVHFIAGLGVYLFARKIGASTMGALFGGIAFAFSGFFLTVQFYSYFQAGAGMIGLVLWALESARRSEGFAAFAKWILIASIFIAIQLFAGHPQIALMSGMLYAAHALWFSLSGKKDFRYLAGAVVAGAIAAAMTAAAIIPANELVNLSYRETIPWERFTGLSVSPLQALASALLFMPTEDNAYSIWIGVPVAALAWIGFRGGEKNITRFLAICVGGSLLLALGKYTPLYHVLFHVPVFNRFSAPHRFGLDFCFALAVLASLGWDRLKIDGAKSLSGKLKYAAILAVIVVAGGIASTKPLFFLQHALLNLPVLVASYFVIRSILGGKSKPIMEWSLIPLAVIAPWILWGGPLYEGNDPRPERSPHWETVEKLVEGTPHARHLDFVDLSKCLPESARVLPAHNINIYAKWSDVVGYQPLMLSRYGDFMNMDFTGIIGMPQRSFYYTNRTLDLLNAKALTIPAEYFSKPETPLRLIDDRKSSDGISFGENIDISLLPGQSMEIAMPAGIRDIDGVAILSSMSNSSDIAQGAEVASIIIESADGSTKELDVRAGIETAESMYVERSDARPEIVASGVPFFKPIAMPLWKGLEHKFNFTERPVIGVALTTYLYNAENVPNGETVASITVTGADGSTKVVELKAGIDTAQWTAGGPGVTTAHSPGVKAEEFATEQARGNYFLAVKKFDAPVNATSFTIKSLLKTDNSGIYIGRVSIMEGDGKFSSIDATGSAHQKARAIARKGDTGGFSYIAKWDTGRISARKMIVSNRLPSGSKTMFGVRCITFITPNGQSWPMHPVDLALNDPKRFRLARADDIAYVYENLNALPRAWLAPEYFVLPPEQIITAIQTSKLPHGGAFDPLKTALIEKAPKSGIGVQLTKTPDKDWVRFDEYGQNNLKISVGATKRSILVVSEIFYPGWETTVDGKSVETMQVDYVLRGIVIDPGEHVVEMNFRPRSVIVGRAITASTLAFALLGIAVCAIIERKKRA